MQRSTRWLWITFALAMPATATFAQTDMGLVDDARCGSCYENQDGTAHVFGSIPFPYGSNRMSCFLFNTCHSNSQEGSCLRYHASCPDEAALQRASDVLAAAVRQNRHELIAELRTALPHNLDYDAETLRLTLRDCEGDVVDAYRLSS